MPTEFLFVRFLESRRVRIDGVPSGTTGETLFIDRGRAVQPGVAEHLAE